MSQWIIHWSINSVIHSKSQIHSETKQTNTIKSLKHSLKWFVLKIVQFLSLAKTLLACLTMQWPQLTISKATLIYKLNEQLCTPNTHTITQSYNNAFCVNGWVNCRKVYNLKQFRSKVRISITYTNRILDYRFVHNGGVWKRSRLIETWRCTLDLPVWVAQASVFEQQRELPHIPARRKPH